MSSLAGLDFLTFRRCTSLAFLITLMLIGISCQRGTGNFLTDLDETRRVTADARLQFSQAADASGRAVMADTDEASVQSAEHAEALLKAVQSDVVVLERLLQSLQFANERETLQRFKGDFAKYQALERTILALAVENTNLKAQRLSFGPAREAAKSFRDSLGALPPSVPPKDRCRVETLVNKASSALSEIQALQAPHIAEPDDATMTKLEQEMNGFEAAAKSTLDELSGLVQPNAREQLTAASAALDRFKAVSTEIVTLSRRNSNVRSLDLSLRVKPPLTTACDESLRALQDALAKEGSKATR